MLQNNEYDQAAQTIKMGSLIAYPTETLWGIGCDPWNEHAVNRLALLKKRPHHKGFILIASALSQIQALLAPLNSECIQRLQSSYDNKPTTWLLPDTTEWVPRWVKKEHSTVAIRISPHSIVKYLCQTLNQPIISTSANYHGQPPLNHPSEIAQTFDKNIDYIINQYNPLEETKQPSLMIDLLTLQQIR
ncbi:MAG: threonylcarbamoyl-AMP synthase [Endozoicomonadaceae bacterium]|nr:threonylcarbamoyl-AMP synthase [Endozoicomonadaceae bacterium]